MRKKSCWDEDEFFLLKRDEKLQVIWDLEKSNQREANCNLRQKSRMKIRIRGVDFCVGRRREVLRVKYERFSSKEDDAIFLNFSSFKIISGS